MSVPAALLERLQTKLGVGLRQVNNRINERARTLMLPREVAALALALESGININRYATDDDWAAIRTAASHAAVGRTEPAPSPPTKARSRRVEAASGRPRATTTRDGANRARVFVVSGRNTSVKRSVFRFLRALGLDPKDFNDYLAATRKASPYLSEVLEQAFKDVRAAVVLFTPDDVARLKTEYQRASDPPFEKKLVGQARPNVIFEAGAAFALMPDRTVLVQVGEVRPFSDLGGLHFVHLTNHAERRQELAQKLRTAGCSVNFDGRDWLTEGDFSIPST